MKEKEEVYGELKTKEERRKERKRKKGMKNEREEEAEEGQLERKLIKGKT